LRQQHEMMIDIAAAAARLLFQTAAGGNINLAADDRLDPFLSRRLIEIDRPVKNAVVRQRQRGHSQFMRPLHEPVQTTGAIEQRELRMQMEMNKVGMRHNRNLPGPASFTQGGLRSTQM